MSIDFKYILRYGIPGWFTLILLGVNLIIYFQISIKELLNADYSNLTPLILGLLTVGIPIGYIYHKIGMTLWIGTTDWIKYFEAEKEFHNVMKEDEYIEKRYRHLLGELHANNTFVISVVASILITFVNLVIIGYQNITNRDTYIFLLVGTLLILLFILYTVLIINSSYISKNLDSFVEKFFNQDPKEYKGKGLISDLKNFNENYASHILKASETISTFINRFFS